jgi:parallel beta-helix repeat protein
MKLYKKITAALLMTAIGSLCFILPGCDPDEIIAPQTDKGASVPAEAIISAEVEDLPVVTDESTAEKPIITESAVSKIDAKTYYVDAVNGSNSNNGSEEKTFKTISYAASRVKPGETVIVMPGVYNERVDLSKSGEPEKYITFKAHPDFMAKDLMKKYKDFETAKNAGVVVKGDANGFNIEASHVWIEGFFVTSEITDHSIGIKVRKPAGANKPHYDIEIRNNVVYDNTDAGINSEGGYDLYVRGNIVYQNSSNGIWEGSGISVGFNHEPLDVGNTESWRIIVEDNICYNNSGYDIGRRKKLNDPGAPQGKGGSTDGNGIILDWARETRSLIRNNIVYNNGARGICITASSNVAVVNNTFYDNGWDTNQAYHWNEYDDWWGDLQSGGNNNIFVNNIIYANKKNTTDPRKNGAMGVRAKSPVSYQGFNLYFNGNVQADFLHEGDIKNKDPMFTNPPPLLGVGDRPPVDKPSNIELAADYENANPPDTYHFYEVDFSLQPGSPAIGSGYSKTSEITKPNKNMTDETLEKLHFWLDDALPQYDIFGNLRDPNHMDMGAVAFMDK